MPARIRAVLALAIVVLPVVAQFVVVALLGVNSPAADELYYVDFVRAVREGHGWVPLLLEQHNEHRVVPFKLTLAAIVRLTRWNVRAEYYVSAMLAALLVLTMWWVYRRMGGSSLWLFAPVSWLVCCLSQYENMLYGLQMCQYQTTFGFALAMALLTTDAAVATTGAVVAGLVASFSLLNGLLVWPLGLVVLVARRDGRLKLASWAAMGVAATAVYFLWHYRILPGLTATPWTAERLVRTVRYFLAVLGAPLAANSMAWSYTLGVALLGAVLIAILSWRQELWAAVPRDAVAASFVLFGLGSSLAIALGRSVGSPTSALQPRYTSHTLFVLIGLYLLTVAAWLRGAPLSRVRLVATLALVVPGLFAADLQGASDARLWRLARLNEQNVIRNYRGVPDETLSLGGVPELARMLRRTLPYLERERLGPFSELLELLVDPDQGTWVPTPALLASTPLEQRLTCPVGELRDLAIRLTRTAETPDPSVVAIGFWVEGRQLGERRIDSSLIGDGWIGIPLTELVPDCAGKPLRISVTSTDTVPGGGVTVGSSPCYYDGQLSLPGWDGARDRCLELLMNARDRAGY